MFDSGDYQTGGPSNGRGSNHSSSNSQNHNNDGFGGGSFDSSSIGEGFRRGSDSGGGGGNNDGNGGEGDDVDGGSRQKKKANPLVDLIETETAYVAELGKIIKKVAGAWSRSNFPPAELDTMFRNVESIYRVNRSFLKSLREIGPNPASPKALGDLLMRWIDDLEEPYARYCSNYFTEFDRWPSIQSNELLPNLLREISESTSSDGSPVIFSDKKRQAGDIWTLDALFSQPQIRLKYYKKLYSRLLKSTQPGRSDHKLLVGANLKLDELLERAKTRIGVSVLDEPILQRLDLGGNGNGNGRESNGSSQATDTQDTSASPDRHSSATSNSTGMPRSPLNKSPANSPGVAPLRQMSRPNEDSMSSGNGMPNSNSNQSLGGQDFGSTSGGASGITPVDDLEDRLDLSRTLDIFTLKPKACTLQMSPASLPFKRGLRRSSDVTIHFTPLATGEEIVFRRAHIFLLTDLFLVCERMSPSQLAERGGNSKADMWLLYPPLAGKHLRVTDLGGQGNVFQVLVFKKEKLTIHCESRQAKEQWLTEFEECQKFASTLGLKVRTNPNGTTPAGAPSPGMSPAISVTPSSAGQTDTSLRSMGNDHSPSTPFSPHSSTGSSLAIHDGPSSLNREGSFNSVASFPKQPFPPDSNQQNGGLSNGNSPDLRIPFASSPNSGNSTRSPSPNGFPSPTGPNFPVRPGPNGPNNGLGFGGMGPPGQQGQGRPPLFNSPPSGPMHMRPRPPMNMNGPPGGGPMMRPPMNGQQQQGGGPPFRPGPGPNGMNNQRPPPGMGGPGPGRPPPNGNPNFGRPPPRRPSAPNLRQDSKDSAIPPQNRSRSASSADGKDNGPPKMPSEFLKSGGGPGSNQDDFSPPNSPQMGNRKKQPTSSTVAAQMRCKVFLKQNHAQWKSLGNARLKLYHLLPDDLKQLVVENDRKTLISTIVMSDGVERIGKVGLAVELSDQGARTGIVYMLQMRSEESAGGLFGQLLEGTDRTAGAAVAGY